MATKTITVTVEAYNILKKWKIGNESFSEMVIRKGTNNNLSKLVGILSKKDAEKLRKSIESSNQRARKNMQR